MVLISVTQGMLCLMVCCGSLEVLFWYCIWFIHTWVIMNCMCVQLYVCVHVCLSVFLYTDTEEVIFLRLKDSPIWNHLKRKYMLEICGSFENLNTLNVDKHHRWIRHIWINSFLMKLSLKSRYLSETPALHHNAYTSSHMQSQPVTCVYS